MKTITVYSTPTCSFCKSLKAFLESQNIPYKDRDVAGDAKALEEMQKAAPDNMSVPVIVFNEGKNDQEVQVGFNQQEVEKVLGLE